MKHTSTAWERELRIDDADRKVLQQQIDPMIRGALEARGYIEERVMEARLPLDSSTVIPSDAYRKNFENKPFDALLTRTFTDVDGSSRLFARGDVLLHQIGGFASARLVTIGNRYFYSFGKSSLDPKKDSPLHRIDEASFQDMLEDVRAHTPLGYSQLDSHGEPSTTFEELESLSPLIHLDRGAHLQMLTDPNHGDIRINIGESLVDKQLIPTGKRPRRLRRSIGKLFELAASQPFGDGTAITKIQYRSHRRKTDMKLSVAINGSDLSDDEKELIYKESIRSFQDPLNRRFGDAVIKNLTRITSSDSEAVRVG